MTSGAWSLRSSRPRQSRHPACPAGPSRRGSDEGGSSGGAQAGWRPQTATTKAARREYRHEAARPGENNVLFGSGDRRGRLRQRREAQRNPNMFEPLDTSSPSLRLQPSILSIQRWALNVGCPVDTRNPPENTPAGHEHGPGTVMTRKPRFKAKPSTTPFSLPYRFQSSPGMIRRINSSNSGTVKAVSP